MQLCDRRLRSRTRATRARQLPTNHGHAVPTREYQTDSSSLPLGRSVDGVKGLKLKEANTNV